jgi:histidinol-phosphate/aromatic aminotransferase/cobyric acid decarboxylase-like protein
LRFSTERVHGGLQERELTELGISSDDVLDLSVNTNPYGPCRAVVDAVRAAAIERYPDPTAWAARAAIADAIGSSPERVVLGNGAVDLLWTLVRALLTPGRMAVVVQPAFSEFEAAVEAAGGRAVSWRAHAADGFAVDLDAVERVVRRAEAALVYLCTPANPTGVAIEAAAIERFAAALPSATVVLDESFVLLSQRADDHRYAMPDNVMRLRSMTKDHALPGVRVGYLVAREDLAVRVERARPPWTTSAFAQAAAVAAARQRAFVDDSRVRVLADRVRITGALRALGFDPMESSTLFFLVPVRAASAARARMLVRHRLLVRDCTSFGLGGHVRVCARPAKDDGRIVAAFRDDKPEQHEPWRANT